MQAEQRKEALKRLKQERKEAIKANAATAKQQKKDLGRITERLAQGPATPLEVAQDLGIAAQRGPVVSGRHAQIRHGDGGRQERRLLHL